MAWANEFRNLASEIVNMHENREDYIHGLKDEIRHKMGERRAERNRMKALLWADFDAWDKAREREVANLKADVYRMIAGFKAEREEASSAWRNLARYKIGFRSEASGGKKKETGNDFSKNPNRESQILKLIKMNPEGISPPEIAYIMGATFVSINQEMKKLVDTGKIKKEDDKYFLK